MKFAEENRILGSVLVGAYHSDLGIENEKLSGYFDAPWDWESIRKNQEWIIQFASTDDPWIPIAEARYVSEHLKTEYYEFSDRGHFGGDREAKEFKECVTVLKKKLDVN